MRLNPVLAEVMEPPIGAAYAWIEGKTFTHEKPLIDVSQAVPGYPPAEALNQYLAKIILEDPLLARYAPALGLKELRDALSLDIREKYGEAPGAGRLIITAGCNQAFCFAINAIAGHGDEIILPLPYYFDHDMWLRGQGMKPVYLPFVPNHPGAFDMAEVKKKISSQTRAILLVTPNNPTGIVYSPEVIAAFYQLCREEDIYLILDETYRDFIEERPHDLFLEQDWQDHFIHLYSFSKAFALTGYRVGAVAADPRIIEQITKLMDTVAVCAPRIGQMAALYGLTHLQEWRREKAVMMKDRLSAIRKAFSRNDGNFELVSSGAYFAYLRHHFSGKSSREIAKALVEKEHVLALPGGMFGPGQDDYLRLAFANVEAKWMPEIAKRMASFSI